MASATGAASRSSRSATATVCSSPSTQSLLLPVGVPEAATTVNPVDKVVRISHFADLDAATVYRLMRLRIEVFVVEQRCPYAELDGRDVEPGTRHLWTTDGDRVTAYLRILVEPDGSYRIGRVCVAEAYRGAGFARRLVVEALTRTAADDPAADVVLDAQSHLAGWYERLTFCADGDEFVEDDIPHVPMRLSRPCRSVV